MPRDAAEPLPGIIVIHEWWGLNDQVKTMARRLASEGYVALAVDLYGGAIATTPEKAQALMTTVLADPEFLRLSEKMRAHAFFSDVIDGKTTQLILFGMLLVEHNQMGALAHATAARRLGASWKELHKVMELAAVTGALGPANQGTALLKGLRDKE